MAAADINSVKTVENKQTNIRNTYYIGDLTGLHQPMSNLEELSLSRFVAERTVSKKQQPHSKYVYKATEFIKSGPEYTDVSRRKLQESLKEALLPQCDLSIAETVPSPLISKGLKPSEMSTFDAMMTLVKSTKEQFSSMSQWAADGSGKDRYIFDELLKVLAEGNVYVDILFNNHENFDINGNYTPKFLKEHCGNPQKVNFKSPSIEGKITPGHKGNIIHSKIYISDKRHFYIGSANMGSRCLSRTKEIGILGTNCSIFAEDVQKQFDLYNSLDSNESLPEKYPSSLSTKFNADSPLQIRNSKDGIAYKIFMASSPPELCADGRTSDLDAIISVIDKAESFIYIAVGEYIPKVIYKQPMQDWPVIDDHLRQAILQRNVSVKFLVNDHASHFDLMLEALKKLDKDMYKEGRRGYVRAKMFKSTFDIHRFHGSHNKFMVTDVSGLIGSSNWSGDYFSDTAGVSFVFEPIVSSETAENKKHSLLAALQRIFLRDFYSSLAKNVK